jgi:hypothetical protein
MGYASIITTAFAALALFTPAIQGRAVVGVDKRQDGYHWVNTWTSMPQLVEPANMPPSPFVSATRQSIYA